MFPYLRLCTFSHFYCFTIKCPRLTGQNCFDFTLSADQTIPTLQRNISQKCWVQHVACVWPPCCDMLQHIGCCWLKFENSQIFHATFVDVAWCCSRLARFVQQCCAWACALVRFSTRNMLQPVATECSNAGNILCPILLRPCVQMLRSFGRSFTMFFNWFEKHSPQANIIR